MKLFLLLLLLPLYPALYVLDRWNCRGEYNLARNIPFHELVEGVRDFFPRTR